MKEPFKVWITKYVLTRGVFEEEVVDRFDISKDFVCDTGPYRVPYHKGQWFVDKDEAIKDALKRVEKKKASLAKQVNKLDALRLKLLKGGA